MKNNLWIILISVVITLSSCITAAQFNNADDDVYYSPKASNRKQPVMIPEVDVDEIIRQNPPQYGTPTNRVDDENYNTNPMAAMYYPAYRSAQQDTPNPRVSTYIDPSMATESETQEAEYLRRMYSDNSNNWNVGVGLSWWGPTFSVGYSNYNNGYYGYDPYYYPYGYPSYGIGYGYGYNNYYNPYYWGIGYSWCSPWNGYGYCNNSWYGNNCNYPDNGNVNTGNQPVSRPRPTVGSTTPPANVGRGNENTVNPSNSAEQTNGRYVAPALPGRQAQPAQEATQRSGRSNGQYTPSAPEQRLENVNGRQVYKRPVEVQQPAPQNNDHPASNTSGNRSGRSGSGSGRSTQPATGTTQPNYNAPSHNVTTPSNSGRPSSGSSGSRGSSGGTSGGQSSGSSGRRR